MLAVPLKKGKNIDWVGPLRTYLSENYPPSVVDNQAGSLQKVNSVRERFLSLKRGDKNSLDVAVTYLRMLGSIEARFPINENEVNLNFTWYDSLKPTKKFTHHRVGSERASVLFNYAALQSNAGMTADRSNPEGLKSACTHFSLAASIFQFLRDDYIKSRVSGPVTSDLSYDGLTMLSNLMLAQAQACFFEKAIRDKYRANVLCMLGAQARIYYESALRASQQPGIKDVLDKSWQTHLEFQTQCFSASSEYQMSKVVLQEAEASGEGYGSRIAWLNSALGKCTRAITTARDAGLPEGMLGTVENLRQILQKDLKKANDDNEKIYMTVVPPMSELGELPARALAKVSKIPDELWKPLLPGQESDTDLFKGLPPAKMLNAENMFKNRVKAIVESTKSSVEGAEKAVRTRLAELNLPAAVEAGDMTSRGVPDSTWAKVLSLVQEKGGVAALRSAIAQNSRLADEINSLIAASLGKLKEEENKDAHLRQTWGDKWTMPSATEGQSHFKRDGARYQGLLAEARNSDATLLKKIEENGTILDTVSMPKEGMDLLIPDPSAVDDDPKVEALRSDLATHLVNLESQLADMKSAFESLRLDAQNDSIVSVLSQDDDWQTIVKDNNRLEAAVEDALSKYETKVDAILRISENLTVSLLARIMEKNHAFMASRLENENSRNRERAIQDIEDGITIFEKLHKHIQDGKEFYANLKNLVNTFNVSVTDYIFSRDLQAQDLEQTNVRAIDTGGFGITRQNSTPQVSPYAAGQTSFNPAPVGASAYTQPGYGQQSAFGNIAQATATPVSDFGGMTVPQSATQTPMPSMQTDRQAAEEAQNFIQAEMIQQQQDIWDQLKTSKEMSALQNRNYDVEAGQIMAMLPKAKKKDVLAALQGSDGNIEVAMNHLLEGGKGSSAGKSRFGRKKKNKPANSNSGNGGGFDW